MKKLAIALLTLAAIALPQGAIAQYDSPHKWIDSFGKTRIYIPGTADTVLDVVTESSKQYTFTINVCGWISLRESLTRKIKGFSASGISINPFTPIINTTSAPICQLENGVWNWYEPQRNTQRNVGDLWRITNTNSYFIKVAMATTVANPALQGTVTYENTIKSKINSCGFGTIIVSPTRPMTTFKIGTINYTLATLPPVTKPQICRIQSGVKLRYIPLN